MLATKAICILRRKYYYLVDCTIPYKRTRWSLTLAIISYYFYRCIGASYDIITYLIGFYILQLIVSYFTPKGLVEVDEEIEPLVEDLCTAEDKPLVYGIS